MLKQKIETEIIEEIKIRNVVCTADLKQKIDIKSFNKFKFLTVNLDLYRCGYIKDESMIGRIIVFESGKLISVGTKSFSQAQNELMNAKKMLEDYKFSIPVKIYPKIRNIVAGFDFGRKIPIEKFARILPRSMYEPEQFTGLIYRIQDSNVALIFSTGKIVFVGSKSYEELNKSCYELKVRLNKN